MCLGHSAEIVTYHAWTITYHASKLMLCHMKVHSKHVSWDQCEKLDSASLHDLIYEKVTLKKEKSAKYCWEVCEKS